MTDPITHIHRHKFSTATDPDQFFVHVHEHSYNARTFTAPVEVTTMQEPTGSSDEARQVAQNASNVLELAAPHIVNHNSVHTHAVEHLTTYSNRISLDNEQDVTVSGLGDVAVEIQGSSIVLKVNRQSVPSPLEGLQLVYGVMNDDQQVFQRLYVIPIHSIRTPYETVDYVFSQVDASKTVENGGYFVECMYDTVQSLADDGVQGGASTAGSSSSSSSSPPTTTTSSSSSSTTTPDAESDSDSDNSSKTVAYIGVALASVTLFFIIVSAVMRYSSASRKTKRN